MSNVKRKVRGRSRAYFLVFFSLSSSSSTSSGKRNAEVMEGHLEQDLTVL